MIHANQPGYSCLACNEIDTTMRSFIWTLVKFAVLTALLPSCYSSKNLNKGDEPFTDDFLSKIEPGKRYDFRLKTGQTQTIYVTAVADQTITGFYFQINDKGKKVKTDYSASFNTVRKNVSKIYLRKFSPTLTTAACVVPTTLFIILLVESADDLINFSF